MLFFSDLPDPLNYIAGTKDGAASIMIGACANISIKEKHIVNVQDQIVW